MVYSVDILVTWCTSVDIRSLGMVYECGCSPCVVYLCGAALGLKLSSSRHCCWILQMLCASPSWLCVLWWQLRVLLAARIVVAGSCAFLSGEITLT